MHVYILASNRVISPFNRAVGEMRIHNRPLRDLQLETLQALGCTVEWIDRIEEVCQFPSLVIADDLYFTHQALSSFLKAVTQSDRGNSRAALPVSILTERFAPAFQGAQVDATDGTPCRAYDCYLLRQFDPQVPLDQQAELVPIKHRVGKVRSTANRYFEPSGRFVLPASAVYMAPIQHWSCLVAANMLGMPGYFLRALQQRPVAALSLPLRMMLRAGSFRPTRWLGKLYLAGRRCRIDPSAHVEAALLDRRVKIGPNAVVRACVIGEGATIGPNAVLEGCTIGAGATVNPGVVARCCVLGPEANLGSFFAQLSVLGNGAVMCPDSGTLDFSFRSSVSVDLEGSTVSCGSRLMGGCLGDRAFLGPSVKMVAGQELPNDCVLTPNPRGLVRGIGRPLPEHVLQIDGTTGRPVSRSHKRAA
jgi:hypothetical protein